MGWLKDLFRTGRAMKDLQKQMLGDRSPFGLMKDMAAEAPGLIEQAGQQIHDLEAGRADDARLATEGIPGRATIAAVRDTGITIGVGGVDNPVAELDLQVAVDGRPTSTVTVRQPVPRLQVGRLVPGTVLPVKVDPLNGAKLMIDWNAPAPT